MKLEMKVDPMGDLGKFYHRGVDALEKGELELDCSALQAKDSAAIAAAVLLRQAANRLSGNLTLVSVSPSLAKQLQSLPDLDKPSSQPNQTGWIEAIGKEAFHFLRSLADFGFLFTESLYWSTLGRWNPARIPMRGVMQQMLRLGADALPIVFLLSFLIGLTLAFQSMAQLEPLGGTIYLARGIGISMFSEIGPLITAIILAGRSGSAISAELASMVVQDEIKALKTMGIPPVQFLVAPRFQAMTVAVPLLTLFSATAGILAGLLVSSVFADIPVSLFLSELRSGVPVRLFWQCAVKSLVFGWIIVLVACQQGLAAKGGAEAVGRASTQCVVTSISAVILSDAVFSFLFY